MQSAARALLLGLLVTACSAPATEGAMLVGDPNAPCRDIESFRAHMLEKATPLDKPVLQRWLPPRPIQKGDETEIQQLAHAYLKLCGQRQVEELTRDLVKFPTVGGPAHNPNAFRDMGAYLRDWATHAHLRFETFGKDEVWEVTLGSGSHNLTVLTHADTVPAGGGWTSDPFGLTQDANAREPTWVGLGIEDDKGPTAATLVVLKTLALFGLTPRGRVTLAIGTSEETNWDPMQRYAKERTRSRYTLSLDAMFPAVVAEDGYVTWHLGIPSTVPTPKGRSAALVSVRAGEIITQVPRTAEAILRPGSKDKPADLIKRVQRACDREGRNHKSDAYACKVELDPNDTAHTQVHLTITGAAVHAASAERGSNALWWLARLSRNLDLSQNGASSMLRAIDETMVGDHTGAKLGLSYSDPLMGGVLLSPTLLRTEDGLVRLDVNLRRPKGPSNAEFSKLLTAATQQLKRIDSKIDAVDAPVVMEAVNSGVSEALVAVLLNLFDQHAGSTGSKAAVSRAGTYARLFPGAVSFGPVMPGRVPSAHAPNENLRASDLQFLLSLYLDLMFKLQV